MKSNFEQNGYVMRLLSYGRFDYVDIKKLKSGNAVDNISTKYYLFQTLGNDSLSEKIFLMYQNITVKEMDPILECM